MKSKLLSFLSPSQLMDERYLPYREPRHLACVPTLLQVIAAHLKSGLGFCNGG